MALGQTTPAPRNSINLDIFEFWLEHPWGVNVLPCFLLLENLHSLAPSGGFFFRHLGVCRRKFSPGCANFSTHCAPRKQCSGSSRKQHFVEQVTHDVVAALAAEHTGGGGES